MPMSERDPLNARIDRALRRIAGGEGPADLEARVRGRIERHRPRSGRRAHVTPLALALAAGVVALAVGVTRQRERVPRPRPPGAATTVLPPLAPATAEPAVAEALPGPVAARPRPAIVAPPPDPLVLEAGSLVEPLAPPEPLAIERPRWAGDEIDSLGVSSLKVEALRFAPLSPPL